MISLLFGLSDKQLLYQTGDKLLTLSELIERGFVLLDEEAKLPQSCEKHFTSLLHEQNRRHFRLQVLLSPDLGNYRFSFKNSETCSKQLSLSTKFNEENFVSSCPEEASYQVIAQCWTRRVSLSDTMLVQFATAP